MLAESTCGSREIPGARCPQQYSAVPSFGIQGQVSTSSVPPHVTSQSFPTLVHTLGNVSHIVPYAVLIVSDSEQAYLHFFPTKYITYIYH
jgi:hypothetical protein